MSGNRPSRASISILVSTLLVFITFFGIFPNKSYGASDPYPEPTDFVSASNGLPGPPASQHSIWLGDINNDRKLDIATAGYEGVRVWSGDGAGNWSLNSTGLPISSYDGGVCLGDIDNDGNLDIAAANYDFGSGGVAVWRGNGLGSWTPASNGLPSTGWHTGIHLADINHDYNLDIAFANEPNGMNPGGIRVYTGNGAGLWTDSSGSLPNTGKYYAVWMGDVNNDNHTDLAAAGQGLHVWLGDGAGGWTESSSGLPPTDQWNSVSLGDLNLDGNLDLVSAMDMGGHGIRAWIGDGKGNWTSSSNGLPSTGLYYGVVLADIVGDIYPEIIAGGFEAPLGLGVRVWRGNGGSLWVEELSTGLPTSGKVIGVAAGDINNDGYIDVAAAGESFGVEAWVNNLTTPPLRVTVKEPDGGESREVATQHYINWTATGGTPPLTISLEYSTTGVLGTYVPISSGETNDGTYLWDVPVTPSTNCYVRVSATDTTSQTNWDKSNSSFTIFLADTTPPAITNLKPPDQAIIGNDQPLIEANYSDSSGILISSVILLVDSVNVTPLANVGPDGISYLPNPPLTESAHDIYLEVRDNYVSHNLATISWQFTVDLSPPNVFNLQPTNGSTVSSGTPLIGANYNDPSGVDITRVYLLVDANNVTTSANINETRIFYTPSPPLLDGSHDVRLEVQDNSSPSNKRIVLWQFTVNTSIPDPTPPTISNLQPQNFSVISNNRPTVSADYSDSSGIDMSSVILRVDTVNLTPLAIITQFSVSYTYSAPLSDGPHDVYLEVRDNSMNHNKATATWRFTVDTMWPTIMSMDPANESVIDVSTPDIVASYADASGIDTTTILLKVDSVDVTPNSTIYSSDITYRPTQSLSPGRHDVYLEVSDLAIPGNTAVVTWWFIVDNVPPAITNLRPANQTLTSVNRPMIAADYFDTSGIDTSSVLLKVDSVDVTSFASVGNDDVTYTPSSPFSDGIHSVYLEVCDDSAIHNKAVANWQFSIDSTAPTITDLTPANQSVIRNRRPTINANYSDDSGINVTTVLLIFDSINITSSSNITETGITFSFGATLTDGSHTILLFIKDNSYPPNQAAMQWTFEIDSSSPLIFHNPITSGIANRDIIISAEVTDINGVSSVSLYYRKSGTQQFVKALMTKLPTGDTYSANIPSTVVTIEGVEYYLEAEDTLGNIGRSPSTNWDIVPHSIDISGVEDENPWLIVMLIVVIAIIVALTLTLLFLRKRKKIEDQNISQEEEQ